MDTQGGRRGRPAHPDILTPAEWHVLEHLRKGLTNAEIAVELGISPDGVKYHVSNMLAKLDLPDRHALAKWKPPRTGIRSRLSARGLIAGALGFCGVAAAAVGLVVARGAFSGETRATNGLPNIHSTMAVTSFELTYTTYEDPARATINNQPNAIPLDSTRHVWYQRGTLREEAISGTSSSNALTTGNAASIRLWKQADDQFDIAANVSAMGVLNDVLAGQPPKWPVTPTSLSDVIAGVAPGGHAILKGDGTVAGRAVYVVEVDPQCPSAPGASVETLWIDKQTLFVLRNEQRSPTTLAVTSSWKVTSINYNEHIADDVFNVPTGAATYWPNPNGGGRIDYCTGNGCGYASVAVIFGSNVGGACPTSTASPGPAREPYSSSTTAMKGP